MVRYEAKNGWNISFAGCGYMGIYYVGVGSCLMERASFILDGAVKVSGASSGALFGAVVVCKISLDKICAIMMKMIKEARKRSISALHPTFNLLKVVRDYLEEELSDDAHLLASGRLFISLTRASNGENVLASHFASKKDLIEALICSCFFPSYCGWMPPTFQDVRYVDGAMSDNMPFCKLRNTLTVAPFAGESDISPRETPFYYHEVHHSNVSIQVNFNNLYRVVSAFLPPKPEVLAQVCRDGYKDALRFLYENNLLKLDPLPELCSTDGTPMPASPDKAEQHCDAESREVNGNVIWKGSATLQHGWEETGTHLLPAPIERVISKACEERDGPFAAAGDSALVQLLGQILMLCILPVQWVFVFVYRMIEWAPEMSSDLQWLCCLMWDLCKQILKHGTLSNRNEAQLKSRDEQKFSFESLCKWDVSNVASCALYPTPPSTPTLPTTLDLKCHKA
ncbi:hypothetical protein ACEWY4_011227 [Coilia grayii]|uniref:triacylglycerol lipase n=1 Tax=Coilia grayii TaxID=363190 RepID=A0ABD1K459_9TELE